MGGQESLGSSVSFFLFGYFTGVPSLDCDSVSIVANIMGKILNPRRTNIYGTKGVPIHKYDTNKVYFFFLSLSLCMYVGVGENNLSSDNFSCETTSK